MDNQVGNEPRDFRELATAPEQKPITTRDTPPMSPVKQQIADLRDLHKKGELPENIGTAATNDAVRSGASPSEPGDTVIEVPGLGPDQEAIKIELPDAESAERLRAYIQAGQGATDVVEAQEDIARFVDELRLDPVGTIDDGLPLQQKIELARYLNSHPDVRRALEEDYRDPAEVLAEASKNRDARKSMVESKAHARQVMQAVETLIPAEMSDEDAAFLRNDCLTDIANAVRAYYRQHRSEPRLTADDIVGVLQRRLAQHGIDPADAAARLSRRGPPILRRRSAEAAAAASETGKRFAREHAERRERFAMPGAGAGAHPARAEPPASQGVKERIEFLRNKFLGGR